MSTSYIEKLKDPRWQKKRLKILERDKWTCRDCGSKKNTLHIHHFLYWKDTEPWDYPDNLLITLCAKCHKSQQFWQEQVVYEISQHGLELWQFLSRVNTGELLMQLKKDFEKEEKEDQNG